MVNTPLYRMTDRMVGGDLAQRLTDYRSAGLSWVAISNRLYADAGVEVADVTLADWGRRLGIPNPKAKSA